MEETRLACGCVPVDVCCQEATVAVRRIREAFQSALVDGDWDEFDRLRAWLTEHHFGGERSRDTGKFRISGRAART